MGRQSRCWLGWPTLCEEHGSRRHAQGPTARRVDDLADSVDDKLRGIGIDGVTAAGLRDVFGMEGGREQVLRGFPIGERDACEFLALLRVDCVNDAGSPIMAGERLAFDADRIRRTEFGRVQGSTLQGIRPVIRQHSILERQDGLPLKWDNDLISEQPRPCQAGPGIVRRRISRCPKGQDWTIEG
jgi:hypothetical protein